MILERGIFGVEFIGDVDVDLGDKVNAESVFPEEEGGLFGDRRDGGALVAAGQREHHVADELGGHRVVGALVGVVVGEDDVGICPAHSVEHLRAGLVGVHKALVVVAKEAHLGAVGLRGLEHLRLADTADLFGVGHDVGAGVAAGGERDKDLVTLLLIFQQSTADVVLDIIGMCANCKDVHNISS